MLFGEPFLFQLEHSQLSLITLENCCSADCFCSSDDYDDDFRERRDRDYQDFDWDRDRGDRNRDRDLDYDLSDDRERKRDRQFKDEFRDDGEYTSVEKTQTTRTEKIVTNRRTRSVGKKLDLGAAASTLGKETDTKVIVLLQYFFSCIKTVQLWVHDS